MEETKKEYNSFNLILFAWKWRKPLIIVCLAAFVLSFGFSTRWFIRPRFKSTAIIYAPRTNSLSKILLNEENYNERLDIKAYAIEEETEQMMQILNSRDIKDALVKKFNLIDYYGIDTTKKAWRSKLYKTIENNVAIKRTEFGAIAIHVAAWEPDMAANMANEITAQLDLTKNRIEHERAVAAYEILKKQLKEIEDELLRIDDSLAVVMSHGIFDYESQSERVMQQYAIAVAQGNNGAVQRLEKELEKLATWGALYVELRDHQYNFREYEFLCKSKMMNAKVDMESNMPVKFVVEKAVPADKKAYPKKSIITLVSTVSAFILAFIILLIIENVKNAAKPKEEE